MTSRRTPDIRLPTKPGRPTSTAYAPTGVGPMTTDDEAAELRAQAIASGRIITPAVRPPVRVERDGSLKVGFLPPQPKPAPYDRDFSPERHNAAFIRAAAERPSVPCGDKDDPFGGMAGPVVGSPPRTIALSGPVTVSRKLARAKQTRRDNSDPSQWDRLFRGTK